MPHPAKAGGLSKSKPADEESHAGGTSSSEPSDTLWPVRYSAIRTLSESATALPCACIRPLLRVRTIALGDIKLSIAGEGARVLTFSWQTAQVVLNSSPPRSPGFGAARGPKLTDSPSEGGAFAKLAFPARPATLITNQSQLFATIAPA